MWKKSIPTHRSQKPKCYRKVISIKLNWNVQRGKGLKAKKLWKMDGNMNLTFSETTHYGS